MFHTETVSGSGSPPLSSTFPTQVLLTLCILVLLSLPKSVMSPTSLYIILCETLYVSLGSVLWFGQWTKSLLQSGQHESQFSCSPVSLVAVLISSYQHPKYTCTQWRLSCIDLYHALIWNLWLWHWLCSATSIIQTSFIYPEPWLLLCALYECCWRWSSL